MSDQQLELTFEDLSNENGMTFWYASEFQKVLNYKSFASFEKVIQKAQKSFMVLGVKMHETIIPCTNPDTNEPDYKLSRAACYIIAMNADSSKPEVAKAINYFASMTRAFETMLENTEQLDRLVIRDEIKGSNSALFRAAKEAKVDDYAKFTNAGYLGLYNMFNWQLANRRNIDKKKLFEHMGRTELAANLFRITMTEEKIRNKGITGQQALEQTHRQVGGEIRKIVQENTGKNPENLPIEQRLPEVKKELKKGYKEIKKHDKDN